MATTADPPEDQVQTLQEITSLASNECRARLKANENDLSRALDEYFNDPGSTKYKWDESQFSMDREGETTTAVPSFNIQGPDDLTGLPSLSYQGSKAPTRPPSRTNNRSPLGRLVGLTANAAGAPTNAAQEDADLQRALAESAAESGIPPQESGIIGDANSVPYFGPATRPEYEQEQWAMVPTKADQNVAAEPPPSSRKRAPNSPAFLRSSKDHHLGGLLSIYSQIPLARNALLQAGKTEDRTYGHNSEWWKGSAILRPDVLAAINRGENVWGDQAFTDFVEELHRLMAFLDRSERSYASIDQLAESTPLDPSHGAWLPDIDSRFFEALKAESESNEDPNLLPFWTKGRFALASPRRPDTDHIDVMDEDEEEREANFAFLDLSLDEAQFSWTQSLYQVLDHLLWQAALSPEQPFPEQASYAVLAEPAEIVTMRFPGNGPGKPIDIPRVFYLDRYLEERKDFALHAQMQWLTAKRQGLQVLDNWQRDRLRCTELNGWFHQEHDRRLCLNKFKEVAQWVIDRQQKDAQWRYHEQQYASGKAYSMNDLHNINTWTGPFELTAKEEERKREMEEIIDGCEDKLERLKREMDAMSEVQQDLQWCVENISLRLTKQEDEVDESYTNKGTEKYRPEYWNPTHQYTLRGISISKDVSYVCTRGQPTVTTPDLIQVGDDRAPPVLPNEQWWKLSYVEGDANQGKAEKVTEEAVLRAASIEVQNSVVVYATEAAMQAAPLELPESLRLFIKRDNRAFQQELAQESSVPQAAPTAPAVPAGPSTEHVEDWNHVPTTSPAKRKYSASSSVATNGSSLSSLPGTPTFSDDRDPFMSMDDSDLPTTHHTEQVDFSHRRIMSGAERPESLDGIVDELKKSRVGNLDASATSHKRQSYGADDMQEMAELTPKSERKAPEMQERVGSMLFNARSGNHTSQQSMPIDLMDMEIPPEHDEH